MSSSLFGIGTSGLAAAQRGLATTGHNIANVDTPGYSRQRVELGTRPAQHTTNGSFGTGVNVITVSRVFDGFIVNQIRGSTAAAGEFAKFHELSAQIDNVLANSSSGITPAMQEFFAATQALADDPSSIAARQVLIGEASTLVDRFHQLDQRLLQMDSAVNSELHDVVGEINSLSLQVGSLNQKISLAESSTGQPANDLRDERDEVIRKISERIGIATLEQDDGAINITVGGGQALVVGTNVAQLSVIGNEFDPTRGEIAFTVSGVTAVISELITGGELSGVMDFRERVLDQARDALGRVAFGITNTVNEQHRLGMDLDGLAGTDFFTPLATSSPAVLSSAGNIGAPSAVIGVVLADVGAVDAGQYRLERIGAAHTLTRLSDNTVFTLNTFPGAPETIDGMTFSLGAGVIADGDSFLIQPTRTAAQDMGMVILGTRQIAAAAPIRTAASLNNTGSANVSAGIVNSTNNAVTLSFTTPTTFDVVDNTTGATLSAGVAYVPGSPISFNGWSVDISGAPNSGDAFTVDRTVTAEASGNAGSGAISVATLSSPISNLTDPVTLTFNSPANTFTVTGATIGSPSVNVPYTPGMAISYNGWTLNVSGIPDAGDTFSVTPNSGGVGDNRNALSIASLQSADTLESHGSTFGEAYGQLVALVGTQTQQAEVNSTAQQVLLEQAVETRNSTSGVNLDEEAANLMRLQQAFEANAQVISIVNEIFDSLMAAVRS